MIRKTNYFILLLSNFNNNLNSMQISNLLSNNSTTIKCNETIKINAIPLKKYPSFLNLPEEIKQYIIEQLIDINKFNDIIEKIKNTDNIFELYSLDIMNFKKELIKDLKNLRLTSHQLKDSAQHYINKFKNAFKEKEKVFIKDIKEKYVNYDQVKLNSKLENLLKQDFFNRFKLEEAVKLIIAGANINLQINCNLNTLILATCYGYKDIVELLLNHKDIDINIKDNSGYTALMFIVVQGYKDIVELLLNHKNIDVNIKDDKGYTALMWAARRGHKDIVELLLNKGADINAKDNDDNTALMIAYKNGYKDIFKLIKSKITFKK